MHRLRVGVLAGAAAALAGGLLYAAHPPLDQGWVGLVALVPLLGALRVVSAGPRPLRNGGILGFLAGTLFFGMLLNWISRFGVLPWALLTITQAAYMALFGAIVAAWGNRRGRGIVAVLVWVGLEVGRSRFPLGGFPWGVLGVTQHGGGPVLDAARIGGVFLVSAVAASISVALETILAFTWSRWFHPVTRRGHDFAPGSRSSVLASLSFLLALVVALPLLPAAPAPTGDTIDMAAVQGNDIELPPTVDRLNRVRIERVVARMAAATQQLIEAPAPDLVVWPENSLDNDYRQDPKLADLVAQTKRSIDDAPLLAGTLLDGPRPGTAYNTLAIIGDDEEITQAYRKRKLVPFGEYVPARRWLDWFPPLEQIPIDYLPGDGPELFEIGSARVGPVTCFESVFARIVHDQVRAGAEVLVVSTNNASFGRTAASRQHLAFSQVRAVETGRWILHAGISGISGVVDPQGVVTQRTQLFEQAVVRADLPLVEEDTVALWLQPWLERAALIALFVVMIVVIAISRGRTRSPEESPTRELVEAKAADG